MRVARNPNAVLGYLRVSTDEQSLGSEAQRRTIEEYAARNNLTVVAWFEDFGVSGAAPIEKRIGLCNALEHLRVSDCSGLIVAKIDRLARDASIAEFLSRELVSMACRLLSADGIGNGAGAEDQLIRGIFNQFAQFERALIRQRTRRALAVKKSRGERVGQIPFGYQVSVDGKLVLDVREQALIVEIRHRHARGQSVRSIAAELNARGEVAKTGRWHKTSVWNLVRSV